MLIISFIQNIFSSQFLKFLLVGGFAALVNFFSRFLFQLFFPYVMSVALAFSLGTVISFIFNKAFTFEAYDERTVIQFVKFIIIAILGIVFASFIAWLGMFIYNLLKNTLITTAQMELVVHIIAIGGITIYNFLAMKYFAFRKLRGRFDIKLF